MFTRTLVVFAALAGIAVGQTYVDGVLVSGPGAPGPSTKAAPVHIPPTLSNPQGTNYASGIESNGVHVWCGSAFNATIQVADVAGNPVGSFNVPSSGVRGIAYDDNPSTAASPVLWISVWSARTVYQVDAATGTTNAQWVVPFGNGHPNGIALDKDPLGNTILIISDEENSVHWVDTNGAAWPAASPRVLALPNAGSYQPRGLALIGDSLFAGYQSVNYVNEYDVNTGAQISQFNSNDPSYMPINGIQFQQGVGLGGGGTLWITGGGSTSFGAADCYHLGKWGAYWKNLGNALAGTTTPSLDGDGDLAGGTQATLNLTNALPGSIAVLILGATAINAPLLGGVVVPYPNIMIFGVPTGPGSITLSGLVPNPMPTGLSIYAQWWIADPLGPMGYSASNGVTQTSP